MKKQKKNKKTQSNFEFDHVKQQGSTGKTVLL